MEYVGWLVPPPPMMMVWACNSLAMISTDKYRFANIPSPLSTEVYNECMNRRGFFGSALGGIAIGATPAIVPSKRELNARITPPRAAAPTAYAVNWNKTATSSVSTDIIDMENYYRRKGLLMRPLR